MSFCRLLRIGKGVSIALAAVMLFAGSSFAFKAKAPQGTLDELAFTSPRLRVTDTVADSQFAPAAIPNLAAISAMLAELGPAWSMAMELRSGRPTLIEGGAIPWIPGSANALTWQSFGAFCTDNSCIPIETVEALARQFLQRYPQVFMLDGYDLAVDRNGSGPVWNSLYILRFQPYYKGVILKGASVIFRINNGNLIQVVVDKVGKIPADATPVLNLDGAWSAMYGYIGGAADDTVIERGNLEFVPVTPKGLDPEVFNGQVGSMLDYILVWRYFFQRKGVAGTWEALVDARTGELLRFGDSDRYGHVHGGIRPSDGLPPEEDRPFPFADTGQPSPNNYTDSAGNFTGNNATITLTGKYAHIVDACGAINFTTTTGLADFGSGPADLNLTDCSTPTPNNGGLGNTKPTRTLFYNVTAINLKAQSYSPLNTWLTSSFITCNVNGAAECNARGGGSAVYFYKKIAGSCNNLGEIPFVALHEWAHNYDSNDGSGAQSMPVETYADWTATIQTHSSCAGAGFLIGVNCNRYGDACTDCTGIRDADWDKHASHTPWKASNQGTGGVWDCGGGGSYNGPCGWEDHCESGLSTQALWDFVNRDLIDPCPSGAMCNGGYSPLDLTSAWMLEDRLWFTGVSTLDNAYSCSGGVTTGCTGDSLYAVMRAMDDDGDGTGNGTPHAHAIYHAMTRHEIGCGADGDATNQNYKNPTCPSMTATSLSATAGSNQTTLNWSEVTGATRYFIFRNEAGCDVAFMRIATVDAPTTTYVDNGVVNGVTYYYRFQAATANDSCTSNVSNCITSTPQPCMGSVSLHKPLYNCSDTVNVSVLDSTPGSSPWTVQAWSTTDATHKTITLANEPVGSATYTGSFATTTGSAGATQVRVANGDTLTVQYIDPDWCGAGSHTVTSTATIDCVGPVISNVLVTNITDSTATVTWTTNEAANSRVTYGLSGPPGTNKDDLTNFVTGHSLTLTGLTGCTPYFFSVTGTDVAGNSATDTNGGAYFSFTTYGRMFAMPQDDVEGGVKSWVPTSNTSTVWHIDTCHANSPTHAWKAGASDAPTCTAQYGISTDAYLTWSANITLGAAGHGYHLRFMSWYDTEQNSGCTYDPIRPQISTDGGTNWTTLATECGASGGWVQKDYDLAAFTGSTVRVRFWFHSDGGVNGEGWYVDDISVSKAAGCSADVLYAGHTFTEACNGNGTGGGNGVLEPGEDAVITIAAVNSGMQNATNVMGTLTTSTPGVTVTDNSATFPNMTANGGTGSSQSPHFTVHVDSAVTCVTAANFILHTTSTENPSGSDSGFSINVGQAGGAAATYVSTDVPKAIPDSATVTSTVAVTDPGTIIDVNVTITSLTHTYDGDLDIFLIAPDATRVELTTDNGGTGENYTNTVFDDEASASITTGTAPFTGSFRPEGLLSALDGKTANGTWTLEVTDDAGSDTGTLNDWSITITTSTPPLCNVCEATGPNVQYDGSFNPAASLAQVCGDDDLVVEPGEDWRVTVHLKNTGNEAATNTVANLAVNAGGVAATIQSGNPGAYGTLTSGGGTGTADFVFRVSNTAVCTVSSAILFDMTGISSTEKSYPSQPAVFSVPVGVVTAGENQTAMQVTTPLNATGNTVNTTLAPAFTLAAASTATLSCTSGYTPGAESPVTLFTDDFTATIANWAPDPNASWNAGLAHCTGVDNGYAMMVGTSASLTLTNAVSTVGTTGIHLLWQHKHSNAANSLAVEWYDGAAWTAVPGSPFTNNTAWQCSNDVTLPAEAEGKVGFKVRFTLTAANTTRNTLLDTVRITGTGAFAGSWTASARVSLVDPSSTVTVLKAYGAADASPYNVKAYYTGPGTYQIRLEENAGGTATITAGSMHVVRDGTSHCAVSSCGSTAPPPVKDTGANAVKFTKGAGTVLSVTYDSTSCSADKVIILYNSIGTWTGYAGCAQDNGGNGGTATVDPGATTNLWYNLVWTQGTTAGHPGFSFDGASNTVRPWNAIGLCSMAADDKARTSCP